MNGKEQICLFIVAGILTAIGNTVGFGIDFGVSIIGSMIIMGISLLGIFITHIIPGKMPMVFWVSIVAILLSLPGSPAAPVIAEFTSKVDFLALCTVVLAYAGLTIGKDLAMFRKMSWRIIVVALAVYTGTFVFATLIAQIMLHLEGTI